MKARAQKSQNTSKGPEEELEPDHTKRIPKELLCEIFRHACDGATTITVTIPGASGAPNQTYTLPTTVALTHVNGLWRAVATSYQHIWAEVSGKVSSVWTALYVERSGQSPIKLEIWAWEVLQLEETIAAITQAIGRTTHLCIVSDFIVIRNGPSVTECKETKLLSALRKYQSDALKSFRLSSHLAPDILENQAEYEHSAFVVPRDFLSLGAPNLKEVIVDAPFYLPPRHTLLLSPSVHTLAMLNMPTQAFINMIYHSPTIFKISNLICTITSQPYLSAVDADLEPEPAHHIVPLDPTPTVANVDLFSVQRVPLNMLHRLIISPFIQSSSFKRITVTACPLPFSPTFDQQLAHMLSLFFQRAADLSPFEYVSIQLEQGYYGTEIASTKCGPLGTDADVDADDTSIYRTPEEDNLPFSFAFTWPLWEGIPQWAPSMWNTMWPAKMPTPRHLQLKRVLVDKPFMAHDLPDHLATIWLRTAARFPDVTTLTLEDPSWAALSFLDRPTAPGDAHSLPFPLLETLIVTHVPLRVRPNNDLLIEPLNYLLGTWRTLKNRHLVGFPPLRRLVTANFGSSPPGFLKDAIDMAYVQQVVMT